MCFVNETKRAQTKWRWDSSIDCSIIKQIGKHGDINKVSEGLTDDDTLMKSSSSSLLNSLDFTRKKSSEHGKSSEHADKWMGVFFLNIE